jgi:hypothetical protein
MNTNLSDCLLPTTRSFLDEDDLSCGTDREVEDLIEKYSGGRSEATGEPDEESVPTPETQALLAKEVALLQLRKHWDPKRFYKSMGHEEKLDPRRFQLGTVIEAPHEYYTGERLPRRARKSRIIEEVLADPRARGYVKRRFRAVQQRAQRIAEASKLRRRRSSKTVQRRRRRS